MTLQVRASAGESGLKAFYERNGYVGPLTAFDGDELERIGAISLINSLEREPHWDRNRHLDILPIANICRNENVVSCVRGVIGPDLLLWRSAIFAISSLERGLRWHQDLYRTLLNCGPGTNQCSVQINFTDSTPLNTVTIMPGSHRWTDEEMRMRGFGLRPGSDGGVYGTPQWDIPRGLETLDMSMKAGQFYVFHPRLLHASVRARWVRGEAFIPRLVQWLRAGSEMLSGKDLIRYSISLRIATPDTEVLPAAFAQSPTRATSVLLAGTDTAAINSLGKWAE
jgi:chlorinating enzyme